MYDTLEEILMVKVLRRAQIRLSVTMCGHAVTRWVVVFKSLQFICHNMGITSQCYFTGEPNYILFTLWLKTLIEYLLIIISQYRDFERITTAALDKRNL